MADSNGLNDISIEEQLKDVRINEETGFERGLNHLWENTNGGYSFKVLLDSDGWHEPGCFPEDSRSKCILDNSITPDWEDEDDLHNISNFLRADSQVYCWLHLNIKNGVTSITPDVLDIECIEIEAMTDTGMRVFACPNKDLQDVLKTKIKEVWNFGPGSYRGEFVKEVNDFLAKKASEKASSNSKVLKNNKHFTLDDGSKKKLNTGLTDKLLAIVLKALSVGDIAKKASSAYVKVYEPKVEADLGFVITPDINKELTQKVVAILKDAGFTGDALTQFTFVVFWNKGYEVKDVGVKAVDTFCTLAYYPTLKYRNAGYSYNLKLNRDDFVLPRATVATVNAVVEVYVSNKLVYSNKQYEQETTKQEKQKKAMAQKQAQLQKQAQSARANGYCVNILLNTGWYQVQTIANTPKDAIKRVCNDYGLKFKTIHNADASYFNVGTWLVNGTQKSQQYYLIEW